MAPGWLNIIAAVYVPLSVATALGVAAGVSQYRRQPMAVMNVVWPLTLLYWGPLGLIFYVWFGRAPVTKAGAMKTGAMKTSGAMTMEAMHGEGMAMTHRPDPPMWQATFNGAAHCGAGCALGDFIGDWLAFATAFAVFGSLFGGKLLAAFVLAYLFGIAFQYFAVAPMRHLGLREGLIAAIKIDTLSLVAYEVGMFVWMGVRQWLLPDLEPTSIVYWFMMQIAMVLGFGTTYPVNWWLIRHGIKERM